MKNMKIIPFDLELAKEIHAGRRDGRIVTRGSLAVIPGIDKFAVLLEVDKLSESDRGTGGHGSTGR